MEKDRVEKADKIRELEKECQKNRAERLLWEENQAFKKRMM